MELNKKEILSELSEVEELHPLLEELFSKLPGIESVEYTHGPNEFGADFILSKHDDVLGDMEYIGIIAKTGKIQQNITDINRQIEECDIERLIQGGKKKIILSEIWVVVSGHLTKGAQVNIHNKYRNRKIKFIGGRKLIELINEHLPSYWKGIKPSLGGYLADLRLVNEELDRSLSLLHLGDSSIYIEQDIYEIPNKYTTEKTPKPHKVKIYDEIDRHDAIFIDGGMGAGKSKLLRKLISHYTDYDVFQDKKLVPVPITFKELYDEYDCDIDQFVEKCLPAATRGEIGDGTKLLLLIDAVDEKELEIDEVLASLEKVACNAKSSERIKVIVTSRPLKGVEQNECLTNFSGQFSLAALSITKTIEFIKTLCNNLNISTRMLEDIKKSQLFKELPRSPIAAIILARLINENPRELPSSMTELYSQYSELILGRWDVEKKLQTLKEYQALDSIMGRIAEFIIDYELGVISIPDLEEIIREYLKIRNLELDGDQLLQILKNRCEILFFDKYRNIVTFKHRTFVEYFYAKRLMQSDRFEINEKVFDLYWMNTTFFYLGLKKDAPEILRKIIAINPIEEPHKWLKLVNMGNYFLAAYASPYNVIIDGMESIMLDAANLFLSISNGDSDSPFSVFSHMHLLWLVQYLIRDSYSYEFFVSAMEDVAVRISDGDYADDVKAYSLFFLNTAFIELGKMESFDFLLKDFADILPVDISLAIGHESEYLQNKTSLMKKQDKKIKKLLQSKIEEGKIKKLYTVPIKKRIK